MNSQISSNEKKENGFSQKMSLPKLKNIQEDIARITTGINPDNPENLMDAGTYFLDAERKSVEISKAISYWENLLKDFEKNSNPDHFKMAKVLPFDIKGKPTILVSVERNTPEMLNVVNTIANAYSATTEMVKVVQALSLALVERGVDYDTLGDIEYDIKAIDDLAKENKQIYSEICDFKRKINNQLYGILQKFKGEKDAVELEYEVNIASKNEIKGMIESMKNDTYEDLILQQKTAFDEAFAENAATLQRYPGSMEKMALLIEKEIPKEDIESVFTAKDVRPYFKKDGGEQPKEVKEILNQMHKLGKRKTVSLEKVREIYYLAEKYIDLKKSEKDAETHIAKYLNDPMNKADPYFASKYRAVDRLDKIIGKTANKISAIESKIKPIEKYFKRNCGAS